MKDPAVLFYFQDFLVGTEFMTDEETGKYIRILCHQADKGALSKVQLKRICRGEVPEAIMAKLKIDDNGNYYQQRMKIEKEKREKHCEHQRENANKRWNKDECDGNATAMPLLNENENINRDIIELYNNVVIFFDENCRPKTETQKKNWYDTLDKLMRIDGHSPDHIQNIIKRTRMDDFWRINFLSVLKLRKTNKEGIMYFTVFEKKMNNESNKRGGASNEEVISMLANKLGIEH